MFATWQATSTLCKRLVPGLGFGLRSQARSRVAAMATTASTTDNSFAWLYLLGGTAFVASVGISADEHSTAPPADLPVRHPLDSCGLRRADLPDFTKAEIQKHNDVKTGAWITFRDGVYDITKFVQVHPGGAARISAAAGGPVEPFWNIFQQHMTKPAAFNVARQLEKLRIGNVAPGEDMLEGTEVMSLPGQPVRHPLLQQHTSTPCNAESPTELIQYEYLTPTPLHYIRHHHPVPEMVDSEYELRLDLAVDDATATDPSQQANVDQPKHQTPNERRMGGDLIRAWDLMQLRAGFPLQTVTATLQCAGNRRAQMNAVAPTEGLAWDCGAISTAEYRGVLLADLLQAAGISASGPYDPEEYHVHFIAADTPYDASIPLWRALNPRHDVLLALEQNGEPLHPDHGAPVRVIVPGHVGARSVKWVTGLRIARHPSPSPWQSGKAYRMWGPWVKDLQDQPTQAAAAVNELPVQSVITSPRPGQTVAVEVEGGSDDGGMVMGEVECNGYAFSGGGRRIVRVDVSADGGKTWSPAQLGEGSGQRSGRAWAWTLWRADVPVSMRADGVVGDVELVVKAVDESANTQPQWAHGIWNVRGILNNAWHRVRVSLTPAKEEEEEDDDDETVDDE